MVDMTGRFSTWQDVAQRWRDTGATTLVMVLVCTTYETMMVTRLFFVPGSDPSFSAMVRDRWWVTGLFLTALAVSIGALTIRRRHPCATLIVVSLCMTALTLVHPSLNVYFTLPWLIVAYACVAVGNGWRQVVGSMLVAVLAQIICMLAVPNVSTTSAPSALLIRLFPLMLITLAAMASRSIRLRSQSEQLLAQERQHASMLTEQRNKALRQSQIAAPNCTTASDTI